MAIGRRGWAMIGSVAPLFVFGVLAVAGVFLSGPAVSIDTTSLARVFAIAAAMPALGPFSAYAMPGRWSPVGLALATLAIWMPWLAVISRTKGRRGPIVCLSLSLAWCAIGSWLGIRVAIGA